jgi:hypothetical protein
LRFGDLRRIAMLLGRCANALAHLKQAERAAQVLACALALYEETGARIPWTARENEETLALLRAQLVRRRSRCLQSPLERLCPAAVRSRPGSKRAANVRKSISLDHADSNREEPEKPNE